MRENKKRLIRPVASCGNTARYCESGTLDAERHPTNWSQDKIVFWSCIATWLNQRTKGRPKGADAEGSAVDFGMDARKPTEGVAIATSREGDAAAAQKPPGAPAAGT